MMELIILTLVGCCGLVLGGLCLSLLVWLFTVYFEDWEDLWK
jgi:hypothetical protein